MVSSGATVAAVIKCRFDRAFEGVGLRIAYGADIIPHLPPRFLEYADAGQEVYLTSFGAVLMDPKVRSPWSESLAPV